MKVLLTGATGFVGQNLLPKLEEKYETWGVDSSYDLIQQSQCRDVINLYNPDVVIHAAGTVGGIEANRLNPGKFIYNNLQMGLNVIHNCMLKQCKLIMLSTVCCYPKFTTVPFKEEDLWNGYPEETNAPYGIAKKTLMETIIAYEKQYGFKGINLVPVNMFGPHDSFDLVNSHVIPALILKIYRAKNNNTDLSIWGNGECSREFLYVKDFCDAVLLAVEKNINSQPINIGTGQEITIKDLVTLLCEIMDYTGNIVYDSQYPNGQPRRCLDISKLKEKLNFVPKTGLKQGLETTIDWFYKNIVD